VKNEDSQETVARQQQAEIIEPTRTEPMQSGGEYGGGKTNELIQANRERFALAKQRDDLLADMRDLLRRFYYDGNGNWLDAQVKAAHIDGLREKWGEK